MIYLSWGSDRKSELYYNSFTTKEVKAIRGHDSLKPGLEVNVTSRNFCF